MKAKVHTSTTLLTAEKKKDSQIEKEALAIIFTGKKFHKMVHGKTFVLQTDHRTLFSIYGSKLGIPKHKTNRLQRWVTLLLDYDFKMEFIPSKELGHSDDLFRFIPKFNESFEDTVIASLKSENVIKNVIFHVVCELHVT